AAHVSQVDAAGLGYVGEEETAARLPSRRGGLRRGTVLGSGKILLGDVHPFRSFPALGVEHRRTPPPPAPRRVVESLHAQTMLREFLVGLLDLAEAEEGASERVMRLRVERVLLDGARQQLGGLREASPLELQRPKIIQSVGFSRLKPLGFLEFFFSLL